MQPVVALVEARYVAEFAASRVEEDRFALDRDLFERFQAVANEARTDDIDPPDMLAPSSASTSAVYGFSHCACPKRDWNASRCCSGLRLSAAASSRPVFWHSQ